MGFPKEDEVDWFTVADNQAFDAVLFERKWEGKTIRYGVFYDLDEDGFKLFASFADLYDDKDNKKLGTFNGRQNLRYYEEAATDCEAISKKDPGEIVFDTSESDEAMGEMIRKKYAKTPVH